MIAIECEPTVYLSSDLDLTFYNMATSNQKRVPYLEAWVIHNIGVALIDVVVVRTSAFIVRNKEIRTNVDSKWRILKSGRETQIVIGQET